MSDSLKENKDFFFNMHVPFSWHFEMTRTEQNFKKLMENNPWFYEIIL